MNISVLSGKGGTGKTTVATNLAVYLSSKGKNVQYLDYDVEEPNGFIFLKPKIQSVKDVKVRVPKIDSDKCIGCGECSKECRFNALAVINKGVVLFEKLCHNCGLCSLVCKENAITEKQRKIGEIDIGNKERLKVYRGKIDIGEPMGIPIIKELKNYLYKDSINIIDSPPGSSCSVVNTIDDSDYSVVVTEPTIFGLHDLEIAVNVIRQMNIPLGVIINKSGSEDNIIEEYLNSENIELLGKIPFSRDIAKAYSKGELIDNIPLGAFEKVLEKIEMGRL
ncbi:MAG: (4Fe-4S)-binding protein [Firmicutes bacterium]|nr:(4Fe-4S)-binding protein [Bacillota bacterium]